MFDIASKLFGRLVIYNECLEFAGARDTSGYGIVWKDGRNKAAHRLAYEFFCGEIPEDLYVLHDCDNPACCNFEHLFLGTGKDNSDDMISKGRRFSFAGVDNGQARLNEDKIREIRNLYSQGYSQRKLGSIYGVSPATIGYIIRGERWGHVQ